PVEPVDGGAAGFPVGFGIDQHVEPAAAGQAEIDQLGPGTEALDHRLLRRRDFAGELPLETAVGEAAGNGATGGDGELRAQPAREAALDADDRAQADARLT